MTKESIINILQAHKKNLLQLGVKNIGLFGSYVRGEAKKQSDIDILIDFIPERENFDTFMQVYDYFENIFKSEKVEIITKNGLSPYIGPKILNETIYV